MLELSQEAGTDAFTRFKLAPTPNPAQFDSQIGDPTMRSYVNFTDGQPFIGNVHPIDPADAMFLPGTP